MLPTTKCAKVPTLGLLEDRRPPNKTWQTQEPGTHRQVTIGYGSVTGQFCIVLFSFSFLSLSLSWILEFTVLTNPLVV